MIGHARLIEKFSDNTSLYLDRHGDAWIVNNGLEKPVIYCIRNSSSLIRAQLGIDRLDGSGNVSDIKINNSDFIENDEDDLKVRDGEVDLFRGLYNWIDDAYWNCINQIESSSEDKLKICIFFHSYRELISKGYPYPYLLILCFSKNCSLIMEELKNTDWEITATHLCMALDVKYLTQGQRQFIRRLKFGSGCSLDVYPAILKRIIVEWDLIGHKFRHIESIEAFTVLIMIESMESCPDLVDATWYMPGIFDPDEHIAYMAEDSLNEAWQYICATHGDIDFHEFTVSYVKHIAHLGLLKKEADTYFEACGLTHALLAYPDEYRFPEPDFTHNDSGFLLIETAGDLRRYASELRNCAASYVPTIAKGEYLFFYYEHEISDSNVVEKGMLQLCTRSLNQMFNNETPPRWDNFRSNRIIRQFKGYCNVEMSDWAWSALGSFISIYLGSEWSQRHGVQFAQD